MKGSVSNSEVDKKTALNAYPTVIRHVCRRKAVVTAEVRGFYRVILEVDLR